MITTEIKEFMSTKLKEDNEEYSAWQKINANYVILKIIYQIKYHEDLR